jgi:hypothetical protein
MNQEALKSAAGELGTALGAQVRPLHTNGTPTSPAKKPEPPTPQKPALLANIIKAGQMVQGGKVIQAIETACTILNDSGATTVFMDTLLAADRLAEQKFGFNQQDKAMQQWWTNGLPAVRAQLRQWASGDDATARDLLRVLDEFGKSRVDLTGPLWKIFAEIIRPCQQIGTYRELTDFMRLLDSKRMLYMLPPRAMENPPQDAILLKSKGRMVGFLPARGNNAIEQAWPWLKKAEARAQEVAEERRRKFEDLEHEAELDAVSANAVMVHGDEGKVFLVINQEASLGVMLHVRNNGTCQVRVTVAVGFPVRPTGWFTWDTPEHLWPDRAIFRAFQVWKNQKEPAAPPAEPSDEPATGS